MLKDGTIALKQHHNPLNYRIILAYKIGPVCPGPVIRLEKDILLLEKCSPTMKMSKITYNIDLDSAYV